MPIISLLCEILPDEHAPYTLKEIKERLQATIEPRLTVSRVHRAFSVLATDSASADIVKPISSHKRFYQFSGQGSRLIARRALSRSTKKILAAKRNLNDA